MASSRGSGLKGVAAAVASIFDRLGFRPQNGPSEKFVRNDDVEALRLERDALAQNLAASEARLRERSELLYETQQQYSSEHFEFQRCMRDLKIERLRNAGAFASLETTMSRARELQARIRALKARLRHYETVGDEHFDETPIRIEQPETTCEGHERESS